jgi:serine/threonine protein kinase
MKRLLILITMFSFCVLSLAAVKTRARDYNFLEDPNNLDNERETPYFIFGDHTYYLYDLKKNSGVITNLFEEAEISSGSYSTIYAVIRKNEKVIRIFALKLINKLNYLGWTEKEIKRHIKKLNRRLTHLQNEQGEYDEECKMLVLQIHAIQKYDNGHSLAVLTDYVKGKNLIHAINTIKNIKRKAFITMLFKMLNSMYCMYKYGKRVDFDSKPENFMLTKKGSIVKIDLEKTFSPSDLIVEQTVSYTLPYAAPELRRNGFNIKSLKRLKKLKKSTCYSVGVSYLVLMLGYPGGNKIQEYNLFYRATNGFPFSKRRLKIPKVLEFENWKRHLQQISRGKFKKTVKAHKLSQADLLQLKIIIDGLTIDGVKRWDLPTAYEKFKDSFEFLKKEITNI